MPRPPFRADHVGSFLRPPRLMAARERFAEGRMPAAELHAVEDERIREVVRAQENVGLKGITDGEFRRTYFHVDFLERLEGVETHYGEYAASFRRSDGTQVGFKPPTMHVGSKIQWLQPIQGPTSTISSFVATRTPKVCVPAPSMLHFRGGRQAISEAVLSIPISRISTTTSPPPTGPRWPTSPGAASPTCSSTTPTSPISATPRSGPAPRRGDDPDALTRLYCRLVNEAIRDRPAGMTVCVHLCRGNFKSAWVAEGGYEPVAEILLNEMKIDGFFLEYDDERSGDFAPCGSRRRRRPSCRAHELEEGRRRTQGRGEAPHRGGRALRPARAMRALRPVRLLLDRPRQIALSEADQWIKLPASSRSPRRCGGRSEAQRARVGSA